MKKFTYLIIIIFVSIKIYANDGYNLFDSKIGWLPKNKLQPKDRAKIPPYCEGGYLTRLINQAKVKGNEITNIKIFSDKGNLSLNSGNQSLTGNIEVTFFNGQTKVIDLKADNISLNKSTQNATLTGNTKGYYAPGDLFINSNTVKINNLNIKISKGLGSIANRHLKFDFNSTEITDDNLAIMKRVNFSFCEPNNNTWNINARTINLNFNTEFGYADNMLFFVKGVPIFYFPYFYFPLSKKRLTGFLYPNIDYSNSRNSGGLKIKTPFYLNLAPNFDATIYPQYIEYRGNLLETELRWLNKYSNNFIYWSKIQNDRITKNDREAFLIRHNGGLGNFFSDIDYAGLTDSKFYDDFKTSSPINDNNLPLRQNIQVGWDDSKVRLTLRSLSQRQDDNTATQDLSYAKLPEAEFKIYPINLFLNNLFSFNNVLKQSRFTRVPRQKFTTQQKRLGYDLKADRTANIFTLTNNFNNSWGYFKFNYINFYRNYKYHNLGDLKLMNDDYAINGYSINSGIFMDKFYSNGYKQSLEPQIFLAYVPKNKQQNIKSFDSSYRNFRFNNLTTLNRFSGNDFVGDTKKASFILRSNFFNTNNKAIANLSIGQSFYAKKKIILLNYDQKNEEFILANELKSPIVAKLDFNFCEFCNFSFNTVYYVNPRTNSKYLTYFSNTLKLIKNSDNAFFINYNKGKSYYDGTLTNSNLNLGMVKRISNNFSLFSLTKYNGLKQRLGYDNLVNGIGYENCCISIVLANKQEKIYESTDLAANFILEQSYSLNFVFKGLGGVDSSISGESFNIYQLLEQNIIGYSKDLQSFY